MGRTIDQAIEESKENPNWDSLLIDGYVVELSKKQIKEGRKALAEISNNN